MHQGVCICIMKSCHVRRLPQFISHLNAVTVLQYSHVNQNRPEIRSTSGLSGQTVRVLEVVIVQVRRPLARHRPHRQSAVDFYRGAAKIVALMNLVFHRVVQIWPLFLKMDF